MALTKQVKADKVERQFKDKKSQRTIANMYNTSQAVIQYILANKTYKEVI